jgi:hypothetical protein
MSVLTTNVPASEPTTRQTRLGTIAFHAAVFLLAFLILFSRRPDALLNAQFYSEDGIYWFADAYQIGWRCFLIPLGGYLNSVSRLIGMFSLLFPFDQAPLVMNVCALIAGIIPIHIFLSSRFNFIRLDIRLLCSLLYLALPNSFELHATTTNIQWHLALAGCLILLGNQQSRPLWRFFDFCLLILTVLDGPLGILLIPAALTMRWISRDRRYNLALAALIPGALLQFLFLFFASPRRPAPNGAGIVRLINILGGQIFFSGIFGLRTSDQLYHSGLGGFLFFDAAIALIIGICCFAYGLRHGNLRLRLFCLFAGLVIVFALIHPLASTEGIDPQWALLQVPGCGNRYYYFPMLAFFTTLIWMAADTTAKSKFPRYSALALLALLPIGICRDWHYKPFTDLHFKNVAADFRRAPSGTQFAIPLNPGVTMRITKR